MKSISGWFNKGNGTNSIGFTGLPGGYRGGGATFGAIGDKGIWWSSTAIDPLGSLFVASGINLFDYLGLGRRPNKKIPL